MVAPEYLAESDDTEDSSDDEDTDDMVTQKLHDSLSANKLLEDVDEQVLSSPTIKLQKSHKKPKIEVMQKDEDPQMVTW